MVFTEVIRKGVGTIDKDAVIQYPGFFHYPFANRTETTV